MNVFVRFTVICKDANVMMVKEFFAVTLPEKVHKVIEIDNSLMQKKA